MLTHVYLGVRRLALVEERILRHFVAEFIRHSIACGIIGAY
jgi:hypothetical protein